MPTNSADGAVYRGTNEISNFDYGYDAHSVHRQLQHLLIGCEDGRQAPAKY